MSLSIPTNILVVPTKSRSSGGVGGAAGAGHSGPSPVAALARWNGLAGVPRRGHQLAGQERAGEGIAWWGKGAGPGRVVGARGVVGEVEVEDQPAAVAAE